MPSGLRGFEAYFGGKKKKNLSFSLSFSDCKRLCERFQRLGTVAACDSLFTDWVCFVVCVNGGLGWGFFLGGGYSAQV